MKRLVLILSMLVASDAWAFSYATGGCATSSCAEGEQWLYTNANEIDTALDSIETNITTLQGRDTIAEHESVDGVNVILSTEIDTGAKLDTLAAGDLLLAADVGIAVQAYDADLADLADGSLSGSKIGTGLDASTITTGTIASTARLPSTVIEESELNTTTKINNLTVDTDFVTATGTYDLAVTGSAIFTGTLQGGVSVPNVSSTTGTILSTTALGTVFSCTNAAGCDLTLPAAEAGLNFCARDSNGGGVVTIDAAAGDEIELDGVGVGVADAIDSAGAKGDFICLLALDGVTWASMGRSGTWVDGGAD